MAIPDRRFRRRVTLTDIAHACGVAPSTVSRALSNPNRVSPEMYERIRAKAVEMGYASATLPSAGQSRARGTIGLVLPNISNPFVFDLIRGSQAQCQAAGFLSLLISTEESAHVEQEWLRDLSRTVDGVVIASPRTDDDALKAIADAVPLVVINREVPGISGIVIATPAASVNALDYLHSLGHRRVAYVRGPETSWTDRTRLEALLPAAERNGTELVPLGAFHPSLEAGAAAADAVALSGATASLFFNDTLAIGAMARLRHRGVRVPEDISVIGCDDIFGAATANPPLTTITSPGERAGRAATELLISQLTSKPQPRVDYLSAHLTVRESTGPARV
ncbi:LacI family DNA-binding transcriptional regulator [Microbacterium sp. NPDC056044]|uniref:LacI family DNA-binding transcriptional regulator n=1 Tax=Microbacterium sp. NPDC056044 TaxID=3345690 RepID=UPI0035E2E046